MVRTLRPRNFKAFHTPRFTALKNLSSYVPRPHFVDSGYKTMLDVVRHSRTVCTKVLDQYTCINTAETKTRRGYKLSHE